MKRKVIQVLAALTLVGSGAAQAQTIPVDVTIVSPVPVDVTIISPVSPIGVSAPSFAALGSSFAAGGGGAVPGLSQPEFSAEVCGGIGDLLQEGFERFEQLTQERAQAISQDEIDRLDREILEQSLRLPGLLEDDLGSRRLALGQSEACDSLLASITEIMELVVDYLTLLQNSRTAQLW